MDASRAFFCKLRFRPPLFKSLSAATLLKQVHSHLSWFSAQETSLKSTFVRSAGDKISALFNAKTSYQGVALEANLDGSGTIVGSVNGHPHF